MFKKLLDHVMVTLGVIAFVGAIAFVKYGLDTQCPGTADNVYIHCGKK